ncbi:TPA: hypothetical protein ACX6PQ_000612 [Photobacterium damselae]
MQNTPTLPFNSDETPIEVIERIKSHNDHLNDPIKQGEIVISLTQDPLSEDDEKRLSELKENAKARSEGLDDLDIQ